MQPSSALCRAQESRQLALAAGTDLANVRGIAILAATAWAKEALIADRREHRLILRQQLAASALAAPLELLSQQDRAFSENAGPVCG